MLGKRSVVLKTMNKELVIKYTGKATEDMLVDGQLTLLARIAENERQARVASAQAGRDKKSFKIAEKLGCGVLVSAACKEDCGIMLGTPFPTGCGLVQVIVFAWVWV